MYSINGGRIRGFTLVELMVTLVLLSVMLTLAVPAFYDIINNQRVKRAGHDLIASLSFARSEAVKRNTDVEIIPVDNTNWANGWSIQIAGSDTLVTVGAMNKLSITGQTALKIVYEHTGRPSAAVDDITVCDADASESVRKRLIEIDSSGKPILTLPGACNI